MRTSWAIPLAFAGWLVLPGVADAQIVKCRDAQGRLTYTADKCPAGTQPEALPKDVSPALPDPNRPRPISQSAATIPPMSAELRKREQNFRHCQFFNHHSEPQCADFVALEKHCGSLQHWDEPECRLLVEFYTLRDAEQSARVKLIRQQRCKHLDRDACIELGCNYHPTEEPDTSKILECARVRKLAIGRTWAQYDHQHNKDGQWHGRYVCLRAFYLRAGAGQWGYERGFFWVERAVVDGREANHYIVSGRLGDRIFDSVADAGEAFCEERSQRLEVRAMRPQNRGAAQPPPPPIPAGAIVAKSGAKGGRLPPPPDTPEFKARVAHFVARYPDCNGQDKPGCESWDKLQDHCRIRRHRSEVDCQALRFALPIASSRQMEDYSQKSGEPCRRGDSVACRLHYCSITNRYERADTLLQQCSRVSGLPSTELWWQVGRQLETGTVSSIFVCRQAFTLEGNVGQLRTDRAVIFVESPRQANLPIAPYRIRSPSASFKDMEFKSAAEAADTACQSEAKRLALLEANLPDQG
jgi:hypothetical protein